MTAKALLDLPDTLALVAHEGQDERGFAASLLRSVGVGKVRQAVNGSEALWLLRQERFSLALIDWRLGGMDARAFIHDVRRQDDETKRAMPIVLLSATASRPAIDAALAAGADSYIVKPVAPLAFAKRLDAVIAAPRDFVSTPTYVGPCRRRAPKADFAGPWRRAADKAMLVELEDKAKDPKAQLRWRARAHLDSLLVRLVRIEERHPDALEHFTAEVHAVRALAVSMKDGLLDKGAGILLSYLAGPVKYFDEARAHLDALRHLTGMHALQGAAREAVGAELQRMATKTGQKIRQDRAALADIARKSLKA